MNSLSSSQIRNSSQILMLILTSHMKVTTISQKYFLWTFWGFLMTITSDVKIDVNMCEPHYVNLFTYGTYTDRPPEWICHFLIFLKGSYFHTFYQMHICVRSKNNILFTCTDENVETKMCLHKFSFRKSNIKRDDLRCLYELLGTKCENIWDKNRTFCLYYENMWNVSVRADTH